MKNQKLGISALDRRLSVKKFQNRSGNRLLATTANRIRHLPRRLILASILLRFKDPRSDMKTPGTDSQQYAFDNWISGCWLFIKSLEIKFKIRLWWRPLRTSPKHIAANIEKWMKNIRQEIKSLSTATNENSYENGSGKENKSSYNGLEIKWLWRSPKKWEIRKYKIASTKK